MSLENITRYENVAVAAMNLKKKPEIALIAVTKYFEGRGLLDESIIIEALEEGMYGVAHGTGISHRGLIKSIMNNNQRYMEAFNDANVSEISNYLGEGYEIPQTVTQALEQYTNVNYVDLQDENAKKAIEILKMGRLNNVSIVMEIPANHQMMTHALLQLYPEEESNVVPFPEQTQQQYRNVV